MADSGLPRPLGLEWLEDLQPAEPFEYMWPDSSQEAYTSAWSGVVMLNGERYVVKVGEGVREVRPAMGHSADKRGRLVIFFAGYPLCEFVKTVDGKQWASIIKPDGKKTVPLGGTPPALYTGAQLAPYRDVTGTSGSGVPNGLSLVIGAGDYRSAVHHAAARRLGRKNLQVAPA